MDYLINLSILFSIYGILAVSLNLLVGYTGLVSLAHAAFYGIGAYAAALLMTKAQMGFFPAMLCGMGLSACAALVIGMVLSKFRGDYYVIASAGCTIIVYNILMSWREVTNGAIGIFGVPRPAIGDFVFTSNFAFLGLAFAFLVLIVLAAQLIASSSFGRVLKAIREDEDVARVFGYRPLHYKMLIFVISAMMASVAGSLFAVYLMFIDPSTFKLVENVFLLAIIILGGLADNRGALIGTLILIGLPELLRFTGFPTEIAAQMQKVVYGLLLIVLMFLRPQGILGKFRI
ncbi:MAG: branched-chain amino acid ABC transporter permease [Alphaproteobacteria bacterium PRO2]|nr:branched-chain amino acid ABC transporter permease [Alphaproteobacteria bacterium PRO2]